MSFYQAVVAGCILFIVCLDERLGNRAVITIVRKDCGLHMQIKGVLQILTAAGYGVRRLTLRQKIFSTLREILFEALFRGYSPGTLRGTLLRQPILTGGSTLENRFSIFRFSIF